MGPESTYPEVNAGPPVLPPLVIWLWGHCALKWTSELQIPHFMTWPSDPIGFWRRPFPLPVLRRLPLLLPLPSKNTSSTSLSVKLVINEKRDFPPPFPFELRPLPFLKRCLRTRRVGFCMCLRHLDLAS